METPSTPCDDAVVVVPAFREERMVGQVVTGLRRTFSHVVVVDDGSDDRTAQVARAAGATVLRHRVNLGQGAALQTGFTYALRLPASVRYVVTFDSDGQHRVADALRLLEVARADDLQVVLGSRFLGDGADAVPPLRRAVLRAAVLFTRLTSRLQVTDAHNGLRVLRRDGVERLRLTITGMAHASQLLDQIAAGRLTWTEAPVTIDYTDYSTSRGQSSLNALNIVVDLAVERLRAAS